MGQLSTGPVYRKDVEKEWKRLTHLPSSFQGCPGQWAPCPFPSVDFPFDSINKTLWIWVLTPTTKYSFLRGFRHFRYPTFYITQSDLKRREVSKFDRSVSQCQAPIFVSAEEWVYGLAQLIPPEISPTSRFRNHPYPTFLVIPGWISRIFWKWYVGRGSYEDTSIDISTCSQLKLVMQHHPGIHPNTTFLSKIELLKSYIRIHANL